MDDYDDYGQESAGAGGGERPGAAEGEGAGEGGAEEVLRTVNQSATLSCREHYEKLGPETRRRYSDHLAWEVSRGHTSSRVSSLFQVCQSNGY